ncbi:MAG: helix-turn-helix transcriptional regulator [Bacteroidales bacterium]|nr:helix-turn-helix transcriptional regulator [Bacteroidales bacterium]
MLTQNNIIIILYSLPIYQLLFYTIQLISFKKSNPSRKYLGLLLLTMTLFLLVNAIYHLGYINMMTKLYYLYIPLIMALLPVFYLYINSLTNKNYEILWFSRFVLFIPPLFVLVLNLLTYGLLTSHRRQMFFNDDHTIFGASLGSAGLPLLVLWLSLLVLLALQIILAVSKFRSLIDTEKALIKQQPGYLAHLQFKWLNIITASLLVFIVAGALQILLSGPKDLPSSVAFNILMLISGGLAGYYGMKQDILLTEVAGVGSVGRPIVLTASNSENINDTLNTNERSVSDEEAEEVIKKVETLFQNEKPYLDKRYSIDDLCRQINTRRSKVTPVINEVIGKNFHSLINDYRVREAIRIMETDESNLTMDTIGDMVGFHSRSTFYACFKKYTGQTPKEFIISGKTGR